MLFPPCTIQTPTVIQGDGDRGSYPLPVSDQTDQREAIMFALTSTSPAAERTLAVSRSWCTSAKPEVLGQGYSVPAAELRLADSAKHEAPLSIFTRNQEMGT